MTHDMSVAAEHTPGRHHRDAHTLATGDPFELMPQVWPMMFGDPSAGPADVHLTTDAPPLIFRPLAEYRTLCGFRPISGVGETVTYVVGGGATMLLGAPELEGETFVPCVACRAAHELVTDRAIAAAGVRT
ncbi:MAG: hypothetical protein V4737_12380 [Curtobacterium sp.]